MEKLLDKAIAVMKDLPEPDQERVAWEILQRLDDWAEWDAIISKPEIRKWMEAEAKRALKDYQKIEKKLSLTFVSLKTDKLLRKESYWSHFDELPEDIKKTAEETYRLWKENPQNPALRFKQIHPDLPIFSFRVSKRHRTVGVETSDQKIVWFWVGSFDALAELTG